MQSTTRVSLHDCTVELCMPALSSLPATPEGRTGASLSLEDVAAAAVESPTRDSIDAYLGETVLLVILVRRPDVAIDTTQGEALFFALERLSETRVFLGPAPQIRPAPSRNALRRPDTAPRSQQGPSIPVLREGEWISCLNDSVFAKAMCVLLRTPPEASLPHHIANARGCLRLAVTVRERNSLSESALALVSNAISRASRVVGRPLALTAEKMLTVRIPLEVRCTHFTAGGSAAKAFASITATNVSTDTVLSVVPPFVHITASKVVRETTRKGRIRVAQVAEVPIPSFDVNTATYLDESFEFVPCFDGSHAQSTASDEDGGEDFVTAGIVNSANSEDGPEPVSSSKVDELTERCDEDLGLFIPSFNNARKQAVQLGPQEEFNFVYAILPKGCTTSTQVPPMVATIPTSISASLGRKAPGKIEKKSALLSLPRLASGTAFETAVAVAWSCTSRDTIEAASAPAPPFERAFSSGGVLALGPRRSVAVFVVAVQWRPPALVEDVVVSFTGPHSVVLRGRVPVTVTVRNQSRKDLNAAALYVQRGSPGEHERLLTPLRTAISLGRVHAGGSARVELLCVALKSGALTLGEVKVVDLEANGADPKDGVPVWCAENSFEVFVVDSSADLQAVGQSVAVGGLE